MRCLAIALVAFTGACSATPDDIGGPINRNPGQMPDMGKPIGDPTQPSDSPPPKPVPLQPPGQTYWPTYPLVIQALPDCDDCEVFVENEVGERDKAARRVDGSFCA